MHDYLEAFPSFVFFEFYMPIDLWMSSFQQSWPHSIWSYGHRDIALRRKVMQNWKILDLFSWKIHIFQSEADIIKPFWWKLAKTLFFKMVEPAHSCSYPIGTIYCMKSGKKLPVFLKNTMKILLGFRYFCDISPVLTQILARKLLFRSAKYALWDSPKFNMIQWSDQKVNFFTTPD